MISLRLLSKCFVGTTRGLCSTVNHGSVFRSQIAGKSSKFTLIKRPYQTRTNAWRTWEAVEKPAGITAGSMGRVIVGGTSLAGIAALCYYGLGLSNEIGAVDRASLWPKVIRQRIQATYGYFAGSLVVTAAAAYGIARSKFIGRWMAASPLLTVGGSIIAMIGTSILCSSLPYEPGMLNGKHLAWLSHSGVVGLVIAPLMLLGGPLVVRAAACTAAVVASLSLTAACAPSDKFLSWGGPLALGLGGVFIASIGTLFLPATGAVGAGLQAIVTYGGLVIFGGFMLYDTQKIIKMAETYPIYGERVFDPIQASMGIYMDTINIFIRILIIMANSSGGKRK